MKPSLSSLYQAVELRQQIPPLIIGERTNANGSKLFRERLLADDFQGCLQIGLEQEANGAQVLDLCAAYAGRDELRDMTELVERFARLVKTPLMIDSTTPEVVEACLKLYPGRCIVNSINLEDGGRTARRVCGMLKKYGAAVVALTINEKGMAMTAEDKVATARRIYDLAVGEYGLRPSDLLFDALTFTVGAGDETLRDAAVQTLCAIREIKTSMPGVGTVLGVSNISFGLSPASRKFLNSVFLHEAVEAGLDAAIVDAGKVIPLARIPETERTLCLDLLYDRAGGQEQGPLVRFIEHFNVASPASASEKPDATRFEGAERAVFAQVVEGSKEHLEDNLSMLLQRLTPIAVINQILVPAMRHVGELFGRGELLLPFVLQSAEVMKRAVSWLEPLMEKGEARHQTRVLLATVQGDVHDIGKNLVDIILSNNGHKVFNAGIKVSAETIIEMAREHQVDVIGLSGLLVKSALVMRENLRQFREAGLTQPVLLGGAALTPRYVADSCVPEYGAPVVYCSDAFAGLKAVRSHEEGLLTSTVWTAGGAGVTLKPSARGSEIARDNPVPSAPFFGARHIEGINPAAVLPYVNLQALFRGRWGYRRAKMTADEYEELVSETVQPIYDGLVRRTMEEGLVQPKVAYGYFRCHSDGDAVCVEGDGAQHVFCFPRQAEAPHLCIADYFKSAAEGGDVVGLFVVSIGDAIDRETHRLYAENRYHDYLMLHGFGVEVTDALAEYWHAVIRRELGIAGCEPSDMNGFVTQHYQGSRFGFGYPACPDLEAHRPVFSLLKPERIGVSLTATMQMVPEQSTSAIISHHPQAKYFAV